MSTKPITIQSCNTQSCAPPPPPTPPSLNYCGQSDYYWRTTTNICSTPATFISSTAMWAGTTILSSSSNITTVSYGGYVYTRGSIISTSAGCTAVSTYCIVRTG